MNLSKLTSRAGWLAFLLPSAVYVFTLCPTVYWDDSGELIAAAYTLGIPHPPGHPLYAILGKLFTFIPFGTIAWRVNFMSAFFGALASLLVYRIIAELLEESSVRPLAALCGALFFAFAPTMWDQATVAETSTLHVFFMMLLTWLSLRITSRKTIGKNETGWLCLFSFLYGLSLTNHVAGVLFIPAFLYVFLMGLGKRLFVPSLLGKMLAAFCVGLTVYAYLPIRSLADPAIDWGNPETFENFLWVITARQFSPNISKTHNIYAIAAHLYVRGRDLLGDFTILGCVLGLIGAVQLFRRQPRFLAFSLIVIAELVYVSFNPAFISAYLIPAIAFLGVWIGAGVHAVAQSLETIPAFPGRIVARQTLCTALAVSFVLPLGIHFSDMDRSNDLYALQYGEQVMAGLPEGSAFFTTDGYALFILWYLKYCENRRADLMVIEPTWLSADNPLREQTLQQYPDLASPSHDVLARYLAGVNDPVSRQYLGIQAVLDANHESRPIYWGIIQRELPFAKHLTPQGMLHRYSVNTVTLTEEVLAKNREFWEAEAARFKRDPAMAKDKLALEIYPVELNNQGLMFDELGHGDLARWAIELALVFNPDYPVSRYNLGWLETRAGHYEKAVEEYKLAIKGNPYMAVAHYELGKAYRNLGRLDEAFLSFRKATQMHPDYYEAITALGQLYARVGQHEDAVERFERALSINPSYPFALRGLASAYLELDRLVEARDTLERALRFEPESAAALFALAKYGVRTDDERTAREALERSLEIGGADFLEQALMDKDLEKLAREIAGGEQI
jgi:tetratricopeptide (TPR) repeat protein